MGVDYSIRIKIEPIEVVSVRVQSVIPAGDTVWIKHGDNFEDEVFS